MKAILLFAAPETIRTFTKALAIIGGPPTGRRNARREEADTVRGCLLTRQGSSLAGEPFPARRGRRWQVWSRRGGDRLLCLPWLLYLARLGI